VTEKGVSFAAVQYRIIRSLNQRKGQQRQKKKWAD
jgi:hypothetical protein